MIELPSEVILIIIDYLPQSSRKQMRFVCKLFAALCARKLIDTVYISPFRKDMEVFEAVTQHPIFRGTISCLTYDSAQFCQTMSCKNYFRALNEQLRNTEYMLCMSIENAGLTELRTLINKAYREAVARSQSRIRLAFSRFKNKDTFIKGYYEYCQLALEQARGCDSSWFEKVLNGLRNLGSIDCVTIGNSWKMIYYDNKDPGQAPVQRGEEALEGTDGDDAESYDNTFIPREIDGLLSYKSEYYPVWATNKCITVHRDGMHPVGSPLARSWPPYYLHPFTTAHIAGGFATLGLPDKISDGSREFFRVIQLLKSAGKSPLVRKFRVLGDVADLAGISPSVFNSTIDTTMAPACNDFLDLAKNMKHLDLKLACKLASNGHRSLNLDVLQSFFQVVQTLESISLALPSTWDARIMNRSLYDLSRVFPPITRLSLPRLRVLRLRGLRTSYKDLVGLLFIDLPQLEALDLSVFQLQDGCWEDIIEGLRHLKDMRSCSLSDDGLLYPSDSLFIRWANEVFNLHGAKEPYEGDFTYRIHQYILQGGRHPYLPEGSPDNESHVYMRRLNGTLDELRRTKI
ncbi:MAG: hypothetical protein Q9209_005821 [Squamulea sp. 1 TL-2023]